jgi:hypothetical protein
VAGRVVDTQNGTQATAELHELPEHDQSCAGVSGLRCVRSFRDVRYMDTSKCVLGDEHSFTISCEANLAYTAQTLVEEAFALCIMRQSAKVSLYCLSITHLDSVTLNETAGVWTKKFDEEGENSARQRSEHVPNEGNSHEDNTVLLA